MIDSAVITSDSTWWRIDIFKWSFTSNLPDDLKRVFQIQQHIEEKHTFKTKDR